MSENRTREEKSEYFRTHIYQFHDRIIIKAIGKRHFLLRFLMDLHKLYPANAMNISPIQASKTNPTCSVYINIFFYEIDKKHGSTSEQASTKPEDIIKKLEPPEEPPMDKEV